MRTFYITLVGSSLGLLTWLVLRTREWSGIEPTTLERVSVVAGLAIGGAALLLAGVKLLGYWRRDRRRAERALCADALAAERTGAARPPHRARVAALLELEIAEDAVRPETVKSVLEQVGSKGVTAEERALLRDARERVAALRARAQASVEASFRPLGGELRDSIDVDGESVWASPLLTECDALLDDLDARLEP